MAASASGHKGTDHLRIIALCEAAAYFSFDVLEIGGTFVAKVLAGGAENELLTILKKTFTKVANVKPSASRSDSSEKFVVAMGFRGKPLDLYPGYIAPEAVSYTHLDVYKRQTPRNSCGRCGAKPG